ncbi:MAG: hypothetical protein Q9160_001206 [Pyrenula sp. 1 TL-2023]
MYFGEDVSDQWQRKKQTKEQKRAAKRAKLDMNNYKSARDVMEERERLAVAGTKRTREQADDEENVGQELPGEGLKRKKAKASADGRQNSTSNTTAREKPRTNAEKRADKRAKRREQEEKAAKKWERQAARKQAAAANSSAVDMLIKPAEKEDADEASEVAEDIQIDGTLTTQLQDSRQGRESFTASSPEPQSSTFSTPKSPQIHSTSSSISSIQRPSDTLVPPPTTKETVQPNLPPLTNAIAASSKDNVNSTTNPTQIESSSKSPTSRPLNPSAEELRQRLASRIEALRTARKADGLNGQPARSRQELLESRRRKEEERRAHKKEARRLAKEEEARKQDEEMARRFSPAGSGSLLGSPMSPLPSDAGRNSFAFGRVAFGDGSQLDERQVRKERGPSDAATALKASEAKQIRIEGLDAEKRATIAEKDMWANANSRARGEKIRDNTSLLKKTLKRQEKKKSRSEKDWQERNEGIQKAGEAKQRKREENLNKRKEEKGAGKGKKGKGKNASSKGKGKSNVIKRPGFEGTFRGRTGGGGGGSVKKNSSNI